ncbi:ABC transporter permease [Paenarthrobacter sp. NPDC057981]|uniref:ABC transporter permease n=1 Tax=Paenarthrobacter sp. NPDC057981 TaxID=3346297 RepID=UPI0036DEA91C
MLLIVYLITAPNSGSLLAFNGTIRTSLPLILIALGQTVVILTGGIDLSIGALAALGSAVAVTMINAKSSPMEILVGLLAVLVVCAVGGLVNALAISLARLQPIIATFGTSFVFGGLALVLLPSSGGQVPLSVVIWFNKDALVVSNAILIPAALIALWTCLMRTRYRDYLYSAGASPTAAYVSGVPVQGVRISAYVIAGVFAGLAAIAALLITGTGEPTASLGLVLPSIVAVIVGGASFSGGQGGLVGTAFAALALGLLQTLLSFSGLPAQWQPLAYGLAILLALSLRRVRTALFALLRSVTRTSKVKTS